MKKILSFVLIFTLTLGVSAFTADASGISVYIDGNPVAFTDGTPVIEDGRTLIPLRAVSEAMGAKVDWDGEYRSITITNLSWKMIYDGKEYLNCYASAGFALDTRLISIALYDSEGVRVFSTVKEMDVNAKTINGITYIPARYIGYALGYAVNWNDSQKRLDYNYGGVQNTDITVYTAPWKAPVVKGPVNVVDVLRPRSEYLGEYDNYDPEKDYHLLSAMFREFAPSEIYRTVMRDFLYTRLPENQYLKDKDGNLVPVGGDGKKTIFFFDGADTYGNLNYYGMQFEQYIDSFENNLNARCFVMPNYPSRNNNENRFLSGGTVSRNNRRYSYSQTESAGIEELAKKVGDRVSVFICYDENGRFLLASTCYPNTELRAYVGYSDKTNIPIQTSFPVILQNWFRDKRVEEACIN